MNNRLNFSEVLKQVSEAKNQDKTAWNHDMHQHRWKYLFLSFVFTMLSAAFFAFGYWQKASFYLFVYWLIWMVGTALLSLLGAYTFFAYLVIILRGKK
ncbi:TPA: hypothetical protein DF272_02335 [Candidatus Falkowbacteria bacterium]|nr:hypothetical protein [Candidatus Falkowbacteria bacterium]